MEFWIFKKKSVKLNLQSGGLDTLVIPGEVNTEVS